MFQGARGLLEVVGKFQLHVARRRRASSRTALPLVEGIDQLPQRFEEQFRHVAGPLRIAAGEATASYLLPPVLKKFAQQYPDTEMHVRVGQGTQRLAWLRAYEVDLVVTAMDIVSPDLEFKLLLASPYVLITPRGHPLATRKSVGLTDIADHPQVAHTHESHLGRVTDMYLRQQRVELNIAVTVDGWEIIKDYVAAGLGIAVVPALCVTERDEVAQIRFKGSIPPRRYGRVTRRERVVPLAVKRFIKTTDDVLAGEQTGT